MGDQECVVEQFKALLENQARTSEQSLPKIETSREETFGGLQEGSVVGDHPLHPEGAGTGERAGSSPLSRRGQRVNISSLLQTIG